MNFSAILMFGFGAIGTAAIGAGVYMYVFNQYDAIESKIKLGIAGYAEELYDYLDRMFMRQPLNRCYMIILIPTFVFGCAGFLIGVGSGLVSALVAAGVLGMIGFRLPRVIIKAMFQRRLELFDKQLVDALNMMSGAIRSGLSFMQVVQVIEREMPDPCAQEFGMALKENRVGVPMNEALLNMTKRVPSEDLFMIINSVVSLSQAGGDLSEAFETIAKTIRERQRIMEKVRTLAQAGITQATILSIIPFVMLGFQWVIQPEYVRLLFVTPLGLGMFGLMVGMILFGAMWMRKILQIEV